MFFQGPRPVSLRLFIAQVKYICFLESGGIMLPTLPGQSHGSSSVERSSGEDFALAGWDTGAIGCLGLRRDWKTLMRMLYNGEGQSSPSKVGTLEGSRVLMLN